MEPTRKGAKQFALGACLLFVVLLQAAQAALIDPKTIPKYVNQLDAPAVFAPVSTKVNGKRVDTYNVDITEFLQQMLPPGYPMTKVWGYGGQVQTAAGPVYAHATPGPTFEAVRGVPIEVTYQNKLGTPHLFPVDFTLHWADPNNIGEVLPPFPLFPPGLPAAQNPVPIVTHLHGAEVPSTSDGFPEAWYTASGILAPDYTTEKTAAVGAAVYRYPNLQPATTLWYHDHALGMTRLNVQSGLAGLYLIRDPNDAIASLLPRGAYEIPLVIQDRLFNDDGSLFFPTMGDNPDIHPYWMPEHFGNTVVVNGKVWPNLNVERRQYRFRILNGSNARFYNLKLVNMATGAIVGLVQIGSDGGYLPAPVALSSLLVAPAERMDLLVDFSQLPAGTQLQLQNDAKAPFPNGTPADPQTVGQVMQFTVMDTPSTAPAALPATLNTIPALTADSPDRVVTLNEVSAAGGPTAVLVNGTHWHMPVSETPRVGSTEDWVIVNMTADTHPIHLHLIQFQVVNRQAYNVTQYTKDWIALNGAPPLMQPVVPLSPASYLQGTALPPDANEMGWKDTVRARKGEVLRIRVRLAPQEATGASPGKNLFAFDPTLGPGYVWHCHILDHEDNDMMRPMVIKP